MGYCKEVYTSALERIEANPERALRLLLAAAFVLETVAHLRGLERELLPTADGIRDLTRTEDFAEGSDS